MLRVLAILAALGFCWAHASDPTSTDEYQALEQQLAEVEQELSVMRADRDALIDDSEEAVGVELSVEAAEALDGYSSAVLDADGEAMLDYVTDGFTFSSYGDIQEREFRADYVTRYYTDFELESLGASLVLGGGDTYVVATPERATTPEVAEGFSVIRLSKVDGV